MPRVGYSALAVGFFIFLLSTFGFAQNQLGFPQQPDAQMTPGELCEKHNEVRYPEQINYCSRNVSHRAKKVTMVNYMNKYHFTISSANRAQFKIDHYIPLCMGGANSLSNLWPQHESIYQITDELELVLCEKLSEGLITQKLAIEKIKLGKHNLQLVPGLIKETIELH